MNTAAVLRLDRTERTFSLTITLPRPVFRLPRWANSRRGEGFLPTKESRQWEQVSHCKEHSADFPDKRYL